MATAKSGGNPTVLRILLGSQLRRLREAKDLNREEAGYTIRASGSKMSRLELGRVSFKERDVADLLILYGVTDADQRDALLSLARQANEPGWWQRYGDVLPSWFQAYVGLEEASARIRTYESHLVPGLLQTKDYALAFAGARLERPSLNVERRVSLRMDRQRLLTRPDPPRLWAVVDEAALRRQVGGPEVMRGQLEHLLAMTELPNVTLQVLPFRFGGSVVEGQPFVILRFAEPDLPDVVYLEQLTSALYLERPEDVDVYADLMDRLAVDAEEPDKSADFVSRILRQA
ncbi:MAG: helix-turn-helix domain-containing protein [Nitriliruptorales bacterium]|nr:helix-turn-helix domain-containing protein [Nitriliruptorales bacterium]